MPVNNGVRYHAQQPAMQDLQYVIFCVSIWTTLHSTRLNHLLDPLVAALPPGPGSLDFSPACFGTFHNDPLLACISSDALFFSTSGRVCGLAFCPVNCRGRVFLLPTHDGSRAALDCLCLFHCSRLF